MESPLLSFTICLSLLYYCARYYFLNIFVFELAIGNKSLLRYQTEVSKLQSITNDEKTTKKRTTFYA